MPKKTDIGVRNLKKIGPSLLLKHPKAKKKSIFFITTIFPFPEARFWGSKVKTTEMVSLSRAPPPADKDFFCDSWVFLMKKWLTTAKPGNRGESLRALPEVSKERITSVADQYFTNL